jgi:hypothetical protein
MLIDWQNQYWENDYITKINLYVQCDPHQNPMIFITDIENSTVKFIWKHKKLGIAKSILSKKSSAGDITIT